MDYVKLGNTGILVSRLCFGSLTMGPLQANLTISEGANLIEYAFEQGVNFLDTAEIYDNYGYIKKAFENIKRDKYIISTKSYSYSKETAEVSLKKALDGIGTDYIDIFLLHEQESEYTIKGHYEAIEYFLKAKEKGIIRALGISTHNVAGVNAICKYDELDIIHPIINKIGIGIQDGTVEDMLKAIKAAYDKGKGIYAMKPLGGGHLIKDVESSFNYVRDIPFIHSIAIGMQSLEEIDGNVSLINNGYIPNEIKKKIDKKQRRLQIADWCIGCGACVSTCKNDGIEIIDGKAQPIKGKCIFCGYCAPKCPEFCIKVI
ncbi:aldo/keto reductase [Gottschalkia acidurici 9a]|uniref:Aldo/keto reductase n=1 Tax=Gottschalkia acidurici (strain ATCC 7906 / DSM 604 / BCRC 14475 / CIP 104303 / KCTC 5404 / NCIMB 10678 / 9a) TaxID=1128398 RepID=K0AYL6_GOTA9|nr:aldo/keto reductase [Gottschalkia acidurici]AFS78349.1 aldo/keto reductase [Gottschalkia acidurici 9a]